MPVLESKLVIGAKDETGGAFASIQKHITAIDKQIATFDKLMAATRGVAKANDPMIAAIDRGAKSLKEEKVALEALSRAMSLGVGSAEEMAAVQRRLASETRQATRAMSRQGETARRVARETRKEMLGIGGGLVTGMLGFEVAQGFGKGIEAGATLDQSIAKLRTTGIGDSEIAAARGGYADFAKTHGGMTEAEYLKMYGESRTMGSDPLKTTREMALFNTALRNSGVNTSPDEARSFVKAMDELSLSPAEQEKFLDRMVKVKQLYGENITGETFLAAQRRSSMAAYGWNEKFRENYFPFMLQSLGVTGGNDIMTAYSNYIGKHMQHTEMMNLAKYGFIRPEDEVLNKVGDIKGLKPGARVWEEDVMKANPAQWSWDVHKKFMGHKGATEDQFTTFVGTLPRAMGAMIEFFTHGEGLAARDLALGKNPIGLAAAGNEYAAQNPVAALASLRASIEQFGAALTSEPVKQAGAQLVALSQYVTEAAAAVGKFEKDHPGITKAATTGTEVAGGVLGLGLLAAGAKWLGRTVLGGFGLGGLLGGGGDAAATGGGAAAAGGAAGGGIGRMISAMVGGATLPGFIDLLTDDNRTPAAKANDAAIMARLKSWAFGSPDAGAPMQLPGATPATPLGTMPYFPTHGRDVHSPQAGPYSYYPPKGAESISVSGQAQVEHTVHVDVSLEDGLKAKIDQVISSLGFTVPLIGGGSGRMDSDAGPHRPGGVGHM